MVSGGGTNLQAIIDGIRTKTITNAQVDVVISNNPGAYALERAKGTALRHFAFPRRIMRAVRHSMKRFWRRLDSYQVDLVVLAGFCRHSGTDDCKVQKPDHQYSSVSDPLFLWNRIFGLESS